MTTAANDAGILDALRKMTAEAAVDRVFGTPITHGDMVVLPVAKVGGGAGGGSGTGPAADGPTNSGVGGGFGMSAKPLGVFVLRNGKVAWRPAIDVNKVVLGGQIVAVTLLLVARAVLKACAMNSSRSACAMKSSRPADELAGAFDDKRES